MATMINVKFCAVVNSVKTVPYRDETGRDAVSYRLMLKVDKDSYPEVKCTEEVATKLVKRHRRYEFVASVDPMPVKASQMRIVNVSEDYGYIFEDEEEDLEFVQAREAYLLEKLSSITSDSGSPEQDTSATSEHNSEAHTVSQEKKTTRKA